uniref:Notch ligand N-terminal domain-containing protein n=1 Tax=Anopheles atroparvus TaxID=41427 RepID=A0A182IP39_ANOAO
MTLQDLWQDGLWGHLWAHPRVAGSGLFELELRYFQNEKSIDHNEKCCSGKADELGRCIGTCKTRFRACLKHYQATIDTTSPCTFGDVITPVLEGTTLNFTAIAGTTEGFANPLRFPFEFGWPLMLSARPTT